MKKVLIIHIRKKGFLCAHCHANQSLTASVDQENHDDFLSELHSIRYYNISYDLADKLSNSLERGILQRPVIVQKSGNKQIEALALVQKCMIAADIGYRKGYVYKQPREAR